MAIGVDYNMFWDLNPKKLEPFYKAYQIKRDMILQEQSIVSYWNGIYVVHAISASFGGNFPEQPLKLYKTQEEIRREENPTEQEILEERKKLIDRLKAEEISWKLAHPE